MKTAEVYFDYLCPYCYEGHMNLKKLLPRYPDIVIRWMPCEAHPRPELSYIYSDVAIAGMFFVRDHGGDVEKYNELVYEAHFRKRLRIDSADVLCGIAENCGADPDDFKKSISDGAYAGEVSRANIHAWDEKKWEAVPSYSCLGRDIGSKSGILVSLKELDDFFSRI